MEYENSSYKNYYSNLVDNNLAANFNNSIKMLNGITKLLKDFESTLSDCSGIPIDSIKEDVASLISSCDAISSKISSKLGSKGVGDSSFSTAATNQGNSIHYDDNNKFQAYNQQKPIYEIAKYYDDLFNQYSGYAKQKLKQTHSHGWYSTDGYFYDVRINNYKIEVKYAWNEGKYTAGQYGRYEGSTLSELASDMGVSLERVKELKAEGKVHYSQSTSFRNWNICEEMENVTI